MAGPGPRGPPGGLRGASPSGMNPRGASPMSGGTPPRPQGPGGFQARPTPPWQQDRKRPFPGGEVEQHGGKKG